MGPPQNIAVDGLTILQKSLPDSSVGIATEDESLAVNTDLQYAASQVSIARHHGFGEMTVKGGQEPPEDSPTQITLHATAGGLELETFKLRFKQFAESCAA
jgi:hypothetical protein